jgi:hypothetical protein
MRASGCVEERSPGCKYCVWLGDIETDDAEENVKKVCDEKILVVVPVVVGAKVDSNFCAWRNS